jgi:hypothetical protein
MTSSAGSGREPLTFGEPVEIATEPSTYRGVRSQRVRFGSDLWATVHEDGRLTLGSYSLRFRVDALLNSRGGATLAVSTEPIAAAEPDEAEDRAERFTTGPDQGVLVIMPGGVPEAWETVGGIAPEEGLMTVTEGEAVPVPWRGDDATVTATAALLAAASAARRVLLDAARQRLLVPYGSLGPRTGVRLLAMPNGRHARDVFDLVAVDCRRRGEPDATDLLVRTDGTVPAGVAGRGEPGPVWAYWAERPQSDG